MRVLWRAAGRWVGLDVPPGKAKATVRAYGSKLRPGAERARGGTGRRGLLRVLLVGDLRADAREECLLLRGRQESRVVGFDRPRVVAVLVRRRLDGRRLCA